MLTHCEAHLETDFAACTGGIVALSSSIFDNVKIAIARLVIRWKLGGDDQRFGHTNARIKAIVAGVPWAANFDLESLSAKPAKSSLTCPLPATALCWHPCPPKFPPTSSDYLMTRLGLTGPTWSPCTDAPPPSLTGTCCPEAHP
jgi:hypothetical protein